MADNKVSFKLEIDPVTKQAVVKDLRDISSVQRELTEFFLEQSKQGLDYYTAIINRLKEGSDKSEDFKQVIGKIQVAFQDVSKEIKPIIEYLSVAEKEGLSFNETIKGLEKSFVSATVEAGKLTDVLKDAAGLMSKLGATNLASVFQSGIKAADGMKKGFSALSVGKFIPGIGQLITAIGAIASIAETIGKYTKGINREIYDLNASLGHAGEYSSNWLETTSSLVSKFAITKEEAFALEKSLANIGVRQDEIGKAAENILAQTTMWRDITPEKQIQIMEQNMHKFGVSAREAQAEMYALFKNAEEVGKAVKNISAKDFIDQAQDLAVSTRQWGYDLGDARALLSSMVSLYSDVGEKAVDLEAVTQTTRGVMGMGMGNLGMEAYLARQFGGIAGQGVTPAQQIGAFLMRPEERTGWQVQGLRQFAEMATMGGQGVEARAGGLQIAAQQMGINLGDERAIANLATMLEKKDWAGFEKAVKDAQKESDDERKKQTDANKKMGLNLEGSYKVIQETKTIQERANVLLESIGLTSKGILEGILFPGSDKLQKEFEMRERLEGIKDPALRRKATEEAIETTRRKGEEAEEMALYGALPGTTKEETKHLIGVLENIRDNTEETKIDLKKEFMKSVKLRSSKKLG